jgi:glycosyltransferase involved in cell wall biosynthesis
MMDPLVSVGIPFYNAASCLENSLRSIFAQTVSNWELILVDDGSTDQSLTIAQSIDDPRVRVLPPDGKNLRLGVRLNQIAQAARGEFLARMDADDLCHPERLQRQLEFLQNHPEVDAVGASSCILDQRGNPVNKCSVPSTHDDIFRSKFKSGVPIVHPSLCARTQWCHRWPYTKHNIRCEDYELWLRTCKDSIFANLPDILYYTNEFLSFSLRKYAHSKHTAAKIIWQYAAKENGSLAAVLYVLQCYGQIGAWALAKTFRRHKRLIARRYSILTEREKKETTEILDRIRNTEVPLKK